MTRPRTKTIPGYRIQPCLGHTALSFPYFGGEIVDADFTEYDGLACVEILIRLGLIKNPYTLVLTIDQAREADIVEIVPSR